MNVTIHHAMKTTVHNNVQQDGREPTVKYQCHAQLVSMVKFVHEYVIAWAMYNVMTLQEYVQMVARRASLG